MRSSTFQSRFVGQGTDPEDSRASRQALQDLLAYTRVARATKHLCGEKLLVGPLRVCNSWARKEKYKEKVSAKPLFSPHHRT